MGHTQQHDQGALSDTIAMDKLRDELIQSRVDIQLGAPSLLSLDLEKKNTLSVKQYQSFQLSQFELVTP